MFRTGDNDIANISGEGENLVTPLTGGVEPHGQKGRVIYPDAPLFHRRDQIVMTILVAAQDGSKQSHQRLTLERRAFVEPGSVAGDAQIHFAAERRMPAFHGGDGAVSRQLGG